MAGNSVVVQETHDWNTVATMALIVNMLPDIRFGVDSGGWRRRSAMDKVLDGASEVSSDCECERQGRIVAPGLDRVDRLAADFDGGPTSGLGQARVISNFPHGNIHGDKVP